jgi:hypothetical protein
MSCLFVAIGKFINLPPEIVRSVICDYLDQSGPLIDDTRTDELFPNTDRRTYVTAMRQSSTWGGGLEIRAACCIWNIRIVVHNMRDRQTGAQPIVFTPHICRRAPHEMHLSWTGGHYELI